MLLDLPTSPASQEVMSRSQHWIPGQPSCWVPSLHKHIATYVAYLKLQTNNLCDHMRCSAREKNEHLKEGKSEFSDPLCAKIKSFTEKKHNQVFSFPLFFLQFLFSLFLGGYRILSVSAICKIGQLHFSFLASTVYHKCR